MIQNVKFEAFSVKSKVTRDKTSYLNIKRLFLRIEQDKILNFVFNHKQAESPFYFALRYFDLESEVWSCFHYHGYADITIDRDFVDSLTNFFCSLYEHDRSYFQTFFGFIVKEAKKLPFAIDFSSVQSELLVLGYMIDGNILKTTSGDPHIEAKITSVVEEELKNLNPDLVENRNGALQALFSNAPDKTTHVSASCRKLLNNFLKELAPEIKENEENKIKKRITSIFKDSNSTNNLVNETTNLIQALGKVSCKGDHARIDESLAYLVFELTEKIIFFILTSKK